MITTKSETIDICIASKFAKISNVEYAELVLERKNKNPSETLKMTTMNIVNRIVFLN